MNDMMQTVSNNKAVRVSIVLVLGVLSLFLLVKTIDAFDGIGRNDSPIMNTITVTGEGRSAAAPDIARITYSVMETAATVADAQKAAEEKNAAALAAVEELSVEEKDVRTLSYNVYPQYEYQASACWGGACPPQGAPRITGYQVSQTIEVKVRELEKATEVLGKLGAIGVQNISGPEFALDDPEKVRQEAREEAIEKAREEAKVLAKQLGVSLGKVVSYMDQNQNPYPMYGYGGAAMDATKAVAPQVANPSLPAGESEYTANVTITYEIR